jgi:hypothetical protein
LSPASKNTRRVEDFAFKKPKPHQSPWSAWNSDGMDEAEFFVQNKGRHLIQTKSTDELNYFRKRLVEALEDFKNLFHKDLPPERIIHY